MRIVQRWDEEDQVWRPFRDALKSRIGRTRCVIAAFDTRAEARRYKCEYQGVDRWRVARAA